MLKPVVRPILASITAAGLGLLATSEASSLADASISQSSVSAEIRPASLFVASNGSDAGSCVKAAPCASFARAFALAAPGAVVEVAGGSYPVQTLKDVSKSAGAAVVFRPGAGASVTLAEFVSGDTKLKVGAKRFELRDMKISSYVRVRWGSEDVTLRNLDAGGLNLTSASRVQVLGGDYGPMVNGVSHINACGVPGCYPAQDILIEGAYFHDYTITYAEKHSECLMIWPGRRVTIRNSTFRNCTDFDLLVKPYKTSLVGLPGEITLENNLFDEPIIGEGCFCNRGGNAIAMTQGAGKESWGGVQIRYNSSLGGIRVDPMISNATIKGNIARKDTNYSCQKNISFSYNIWTGATCSPTDRKASFSSVFIDSTATGFDLHLKRGSPAIGAGEAGNAPPRDILGRMRPLRLPPDAGAVQQEPASIVLGRAIGRLSLAMRRAAVTEAYGSPRSSRMSRIGGSGARVRVDEYRIRGGRLRALYQGDRVVGVGTTSSFYSTEAGFGPGAAVATDTTIDCGNTYRRRKGNSRLYTRHTRGASPTVAEVLMVARGFGLRCS